MSFSQKEKNKRKMHKNASADIEQKTAKGKSPQSIKNQTGR